MSLKEYRRKRKFKQTPEPRGKKAKFRGKLRFVVHLHSASRLHFDLRLEMNGVFKSWAVPKGPSLNPLDQRLAIFVEDHPLEYGAFEGTIPSGNYGAGTIMIWDQGFYEERNSSGRADSEAALLKGLSEGHLTFILSGEKLRGEFALVKLKRAADQKSWLLLKKRDEFSRYRTKSLERSVASGRTLNRIATESKRENKVWLPKKRALETSSDRGPCTKKKRIQPKRTDPMPRKIQPMLPTFSTQLPKEAGWITERLPGGLRAIAEVEKVRVSLYSRSLLPFERKFPKILAKLRALENEMVLDGEIVRENLKAYFVVFDLLYVDGKNLRTQPLKYRRRKLEQLRIYDDLIRLNPLLSNAKLKQLSTGDLLVRRADSDYHSGTSPNWCKIKSAPRASRRQMPIDLDAKPAFTHLDKVMFPKSGFTKANLIEYYREISKYILPHLVDKPESLHRHPNGIEGKSFFHKDMTAYLPRWIQTTRVLSRSTGKTVNYLLCQNEATLLYLIYYGCIELNPWISKYQRIGNPEFVVIDLDPDGNSFDDVVKVAREVHRVLDGIGAKSWCKTSGATGLHICVPTGGRYEYEVTRTFAESVCQAVHAKFPMLTSLERNPDKRRGRIYLDFLQNRRGQTLAAPYCVRPRPGAPVSAPLEWREVRKGLNPDSFTIRSMPRRLKRVGDLWAPLLTTAVNIPLCTQRLRKGRK